MNLTAWFLAARPKTLLASISPVAIGTALVAHHAKVHWGAMSAALLGALSIQIGTNFCNDYFDFFQGADTVARKGPPRAVASGLISPRSMAMATGASFAITLLFTWYLYQRAGWIFLVIGVLSIVFGVLYTAGRWSLAYMGLGDPFVLVFFGPVAVVGTYYVQVRSWNPSIVVAGLAPGLIAVGLLVVNNLRDIDEDRQANKRTLAVRLGATFSRVQYTLCMLLAALIPVCLWSMDYSAGVLLATLTLFPVAWIVFQVWNRQGSELVPCLGMTAGALMVYTVLFCIGLQM